MLNGGGNACRQARGINMNDSICMNDWVFGALGHSEEFSIDELHQALGAKTTEEKKRISRNLSYLVKKGTLQRLKRGSFKNMSYPSDFSKRLDFLMIDHCEDKQKLMVRFSAFKETQELSGHEFKETALWDYDNCTGVLYRVSQNGNKCGFLLLISEDDPQLKRVIRYVGNEAVGNNLAIFFNGAKDLKPLFPNVTWI